MPANQVTIIDDLGSLVVKELVRLVNSATVTTQTESQQTANGASVGQFLLLMADEDVLITDVLIGNMDVAIVVVTTTLVVQSDDDPAFGTPTVRYSASGFSGAGNAIPATAMTRLSTQPSVAIVGAFPFLLPAGESLRLLFTNDEAAAVDLSVSVKYRSINDTLVLSPDVPRRVKPHNVRNIA